MSSSEVEFTPFKVKPSRGYSDDGINVASCGSRHHVIQTGEGLHWVVNGELRETLNLPNRYKRYGKLVQVAEDRWLGIVGANYLLMNESGFLRERMFYYEHGGGDFYADDNGFVFVNGFGVIRGDAEGVMSHDMSVFHGLSHVVCDERLFYILRLSGKRARLIKYDGCEEVLIGNVMIEEHVRRDFLMASGGRVVVKNSDEMFTVFDEHGRRRVKVALYGAHCMHEEGMYVGGAYWRFDALREPAWVHMNILGSAFIQDGHVVSHDNSEKVQVIRCDTGEVMMDVKLDLERDERIFKCALIRGNVVVIVWRMSKNERASHSKYAYLIRPGEEPCKLMQDNVGDVTPWCDTFATWPRRLARDGSLTFHVWHV